MTAALEQNRIPKGIAKLMEKSGLTKCLPPDITQWIPVALGVGALGAAIYLIDRLRGPGDRFRGEADDHSLSLQINTPVIRDRKDV